MERVASHRSGQRTTEITRKNLFRLQKLSCSRSWHQSIVDSRRERDSIKDEKKGIWLGKSGTNPEHIVGTKNGAMAARSIRRLEPTNRTETSLLLEIQGVPWDLVPNAPRRGRRKGHPTPASPRRPDRRKTRPPKRQRNLPYRTIAHLSEPERTSAHRGERPRELQRISANLSASCRTLANFSRT